VRWSAGLGNDIELSFCDKAETGTLVRLHLRQEMLPWCLDAQLLERAVRDYADYLPIPIYLNDQEARINLIHSEWFDPTPDMDSLEMELAAHFDESPLDVIPIHVSQPVPISGALYVTPERLPGFASAATVKATVMRMVVSSHVEELLPEWASFVRGVLELPSCRPTASREELVRDQAFVAARGAIEERLFSHFEELSRTAPVRFQSLLTWHRYMWAGHALTTPRLRKLMYHTYPFQTSQGTLTAQAIIERSRANALVETEYDYVVWYNTDRRQERWINSLFAQHQVPCVHATRSFEESLLTALVADQSHEQSIDLRYTAPGSPGFASCILGVRDVEDASSDWCEFLEAIDARLMCASFREDVPVMAFLNERADMQQTFEELKKQGTIPSAFQRIIDRHMEEQPSSRNEVLLNRSHRLVQRALSQKTNSPLASVLRLLVAQSLTAAGAALPASMQQVQTDDLDWITDALWGKN
jgi:HSP90 family molecular chaperone